MTLKNTDEAVLRLFSLIVQKRTTAFAGLGLICYQPPMAVPAMGLGNTNDFPYELPILGISHIADVLAEISDRSHEWHDGFHLINASTFSLTHVAQYITPPLPGSFQFEENRMPIGARHMTAILTSRLIEVNCVALLSANNNAEIYRQGLQIISKSFNE